MHVWVILDHLSDGVIGAYSSEERADEAAKDWVRPHRHLDKSGTNPPWMYSIHPITVDNDPE